MLQSLKAGAQLQEKNSTRKWLLEALPSCCRHLWETWIQIFALYFRIRCFWTTALFEVHVSSPHGVCQGRVWQPVPVPQASPGAGQMLDLGAAPTPGFKHIPGNMWTQFGASHGQAWRLALLWCCRGRGWQPWGAEMWSWPVPGWG